MMRLRERGAQRGGLRGRRGGGRGLGFTLVEVMVSLGVMTIGAVAIIGMEQQATRANVQAREMTVATQIAQTWIERFKLDAVRWASTTGNIGLDLANTSYLSAIGGTNGQGVFMPIPVPPTVTTVPATTSNGFDYLGNETDTQATMNGVYYCASYRLGWVYIDRLMRVDVRVWWPRTGVGASMVTHFNRCVDNSAALYPVAANTPSRYRVVYLSTVVRNLRYH